MSAATKKQTRGLLRRLPGTAATWLRTSGSLWRLVIAAAATAVVVAISLRIWQNVRPHVESQPEYLVPAASLEISSTPPWIHADVKAEVIRDAGLPERLSILDERLAQRLTQAFSLHPWIARVSSVKTSYPAYIKVDLQYRHPVAMVEVHGGLLPIDAEGVLLPTEDFTPQDAQKYPRVGGVESSPLGPLGTRWGDTFVEAAAKLAALLQPDWHDMGLHHIQGAQSGVATRHATLELITRGGTAFVWGSAPGEEVADETKGSNKVATLKRLAAANGSLDAAAAPERDLRHTSNKSAVTPGQ